MTRLDLDTAEYDVYYHRYIDKLSDDIQLRKGFEVGKQIVLNFFKNISV